MQALDYLVTAAPPAGDASTKAVNAAFLAANALRGDVAQPWSAGYQTQGRANLGLGSLATQAASSVSITGGALDGVTIGGTSPGAVTASVLTVMSSVSGPGGVFGNGTFHVGTLATSGASSGGVSISWDPSDATTKTPRGWIGSLSPQAVWRDLAFGASTFGFYSGGTMLGLSQDPSGAVFTAVTPPSGSSNTAVPNTGFLTASALRVDLVQAFTSAQQAQARANLGAGATGTTVVDFGTAGAMSASVAVTGQANIVAGSAVDAWLVATATADHSVDEHLAENINVMAGAIVPGTGFTIFALSQTLPLYGKWAVSWSWS